MSNSITYTESVAFTRTHAVHLAAKVAADLKRMQRLYGSPSDAEIAIYEDEIIELLKTGYLGSVAYGFCRNGDLIEPTLRYTAHDLSGSAANDDDPGRVRPGANIAGASFYSYLTYSAAWNRQSSAERQRFNGTLPFSRSGAPEPGVAGYFTNDKIYSSGGRALNRSSMRGW
jgi:Bacterial HORMA domain family 1